MTKFYVLENPSQEKIKNFFLETGTVALHPLAGFNLARGFLDFPRVSEDFRGGDGRGNEGLMLE